MDYYIVSKASDFYRDMMQHFDDYKTLVSAFLAFKEKYGIESDEVIWGKEIGIKLTRKDKETFKNEFLKNPQRECYWFKKKSKMLEDWQSRVEGVQFFDRPHVMFYLRTFSGRVVQKYFFGKDDVFYLAVDLHDGKLQESAKEWMTKIKASAFYLAHEAIVAEKEGE